jgi:hypothetical protein
VRRSLESAPASKVPPDLMLQLALVPSREVKSSHYYTELDYDHLGFMIKSASITLATMHYW